MVRNDREYYERTGFDFVFLEQVVNWRWYKGNGLQNENIAAFKILDRFERGIIKPSDLKQVFADYLDHTVNETDIADIMVACDPKNTGSINFGGFRKFYNM